MLKSCQYCGRIHDTHYDCGRRPKSGRKPDAADRFRWTKQWQRKREQIRERVRILCRWWLEHGRLSYDSLSVHHIVPLAEAWDLRVDDGNLITLCGKCHEEAEAGKISRDELRDLAEREPRLSSPLPRTGKNSDPSDNDAGPRKTKDSRNEN
ncbi:HNH endonuclease [bacterium]|nr:HNH endonuclease [bacterium]